MKPGEAREQGPSLRDELLIDPTSPPEPLLEESYEFLGDEDIPFDGYFSPDFAQAEYDRLWPKVWQWACHVDHIPESELMSISLGELIESTATKFPETEALVYSNQPDVEDIRWTYKDLNDMSTNLAKGFIDIGFKRGDTVGVWGPNHPEWILAEYALAKAGLKLVTLNPLYKDCLLYTSDAADE